jgi:hypothetical protein
MVQRKNNFGPSLLASVGAELGRPLTRGIQMYVSILSELASLMQTHLPAEQVECSRKLLLTRSGELSASRCCGVFAREIGGNTFVLKSPSQLQNRNGCN